MEDSASEREQHERDLLELRERIKALKDNRDKDIGRKNKLHARLEKTEREISRIIRKLKQLHRQQRQKIRKLNELKLDEQHHRDKLKTHKKALSRQLRAAYAIGRQEYVKLLLNQEDVSSVGRMLTYYNYFGKARVNEIRVMENLLRELDALRKIILQKTGELELLRNDYDQRRSKLQENQQARRRLLEKLTRTIALKDERLENLLEDERSLNELLRELRSIVTDIPADLGDRKPFASFKGNLPWPLSQGRIVARFGSRRKKGRLRWNGIMIRAREGQSVRAVHHGRVVFSDWLRGFGLMLIIDHGNGYMSLYGHNQSLYKNVGEWVEAGMEVATVGDSGGQSYPGLYFEVRNNGQPNNPEKWCKKSGIRRSRR